MPVEYQGCNVGFNELCFSCLYSFTQFSDEFLAAYRTSLSTRGLQTNTIEVARALYPSARILVADSVLLAKLRPVNRHVLGTSEKSPTWTGKDHG